MQRIILFILDDGFQHWRLFRDKNILLVDAENPFDNERLLPVGLLREPIKEIRRADIVVITKALGLNEIEQLGIEDLIKKIKRYNPRVLIFLSGHKPLRFVGPSGETMPLKWAEGKNFFAFCGIGNPESFRRTLISIGSELKGFKIYSDHYRYKQNDIENILKKSQRISADWLVTTEKDMMRLKGITLPDNIISLAIGFEVDQRFYDKALE
jgi:tetraacyldisaccharide 4'-kinase